LVCPFGDWDSGRGFISLNNNKEGEEPITHQECTETMKLGPSDGTGTQNETGGGGVTQLTGGGESFYQISALDGEEI